MLDQAKKVLEGILRGFYLFEKGSAGGNYS